MGSCWVAETQLPFPISVFWHVVLCLFTFPPPPCLFTFLSLGVVVLEHNTTFCAVPPSCN